MKSDQDQPAARRRFTLLDGMIAVAATASGLGVLRGLGPLDELPEIFWAIFPLENWNRHGIEEIAFELLMLAMPNAVAWTLAVLAMRLRRPRPSWRRLARQPGLMACLALVPAWMIALAFTAASYINNSGSNIIFSRLPIAEDPGFWLQRFSQIGAALGGFAVAIAWATLAIGGRWRAEAGWVDRLGRLVGVGWIALALVAAYELREGF